MRTGRARLLCLLGGCALEPVYNIEYLGIFQARTTTRQQQCAKKRKNVKNGIRRQWRRGRKKSVRSALSSPLCHASLLSSSRLFRRIVQRSTLPLVIGHHLGIRTGVQKYRYQSQIADSNAMSYDYRNPSVLMPALLAADAISRQQKRALGFVSRHCVSPTHALCCLSGNTADQ